MLGSVHAGLAGANGSDGGAGVLNSGLNSVDGEVIGLDSIGGGMIGGDEIGAGGSIMDSIAGGSSII